MLTGKHEVYIYLDTIDISIEEVINLLIKEVDFKSILDGRPYVFNNKITYDPGSFIASMKYELYVSDPSECKVNEFLCPSYFEDLYSDNDLEFDEFDEVDFGGKKFIKLYGEWQRIE